MDKQYDEFVGVDSLYAAKITTDTAASYLAAAPEYLAPTASIAGEPKVENKTTYYDNVPCNNFVAEGATPLTIVVSGLPAKKAAELLGKYYDEASGRVLDSGEPAPQFYALSFRFSKGSDGYRYYQYLKGTFSGGTEEATTKAEGAVEIKTYTIIFTAITTTHQWTVNGELKALKRIFADTTDTAFDSTGWFTQVQTPDTSGAPAALALSSSVPVDDATGISKTANITLTFNNAIDSYAVTLINPATFAVIASTLSLDATKKILTINPNADLAGTTSYAVVISKVTDIYNQTLSNTVINFTTGA